MRILVAFVLVMLSYGTALTSELQPCTRYGQGMSFARELHDGRLRTEFLRTLKKTKMQPHEFALCEYDGPMPQIGELQNDDNGIIFALFIPGHVMLFSTVEFEGLVAHELGHIPKWGAAGGGSIKFESDTDAQGAKWVGNGAVAAMLLAMIRHELWFNPVDRMRLKVEFTHRIRLLLGPY